MQIEAIKQIICTKWLCWQHGKALVAQNELMPVAPDSGCHMLNFGIFLVVLTEQMIRNGDVELQSREEEIRFLNMQLSEEKRAVDLLRRSLPNKRNLEEELMTLQIQVSPLPENRELMML